MSEAPARNIVERFYNTVANILMTPTVWVHDTIVKPNQKNYPWYHQKFPRVPTIDECGVEDVVCYVEANTQYKRDRMVDTNILTILRSRFEDCSLYESPDVEKCQPLYKAYDEAATNWFIKYGDLGGYHDVKRAYMKQKHRMIWERRHGPVGTGKKPETE